MNAGSYLTGYNNPYPSYGYNQTPTGTTPCGCDTSGTPLGGVEAKPTSVSSQNTPACTSVPETSPTATSTLTYPTATYSYFVKAPAVPSQTTPTGTVGVQTTPTGTENFTITSATPTPSVIIFSASRLEKYHFTSDMISKYFDEVKNSNGKVTGYRVKSGYSIVELKKQAKEGYEKQIEETAFVDELFDGQSELDAKYLTENYAKWENSNNPDLKQMYQIIKQKMSEFGIDFYEKWQNLKDRYDAYDRQIFFDALIKMINDEVGIENTKPLSLTKDAVAKLNQKGFSETINNIFSKKSNSESKITDFEKEYYTGSIDGEIGSFGQSKETKNCGVLSAIYALNTSDNGKQIIKNSIKNNGNGTFKVTFPGINQSCTISLQEIKDAKNNSKYSYGDSDVLLLELALEKLLPDYKDVISGVMNAFGINWDNISIEGSSILYNLYDSFKAGSFGIVFQYNHLNIQDVNGSEIELVSTHAYAIADLYIDPNDPANNTVTIIDPYRSDNKITINMEKFSNGLSDLSIFRTSATQSDVQSLIDKTINSFINGELSEDAAQRCLGLLPGLNINRNLDDNLKFQYNGKEYFVYSYSTFNMFFDKLENGEITFNQLAQILSNELTTYFSDEQRNSIIERAILLATKGKIDINLLITVCNTNGYRNPDWPNDYGNNEIVCYGTTYVVNINNENNRPTYSKSDILKYTSNTNIINKYFDVAATKNGEPLVYRLKDGYTFQDFLNAAG